jgi:hypothetical protein
MSNYKVVPGPEGYLPPASASRGILLPEKGNALVEGAVVPEEEAMTAIIRKLSNASNPVFFPGPLLLWDWKEGIRDKAREVKALAELLGARIIPMPDYRPKYPMINPEIEINPNHPNLTIWHNEIDVCVFVGVHCHYANVALKIIIGGTSCYTIALCAETGHEDAMISLRDVGLEKIRILKEMAATIKQQGVDNSRDLARRKGE